MTKIRLQDIDRAKGLAILLVVIGHLADQRHPPLDAQWYLDMKYLIYHFHMPFFMFLSGFVYFYTFKNIHSVKEYFSYSRKKISRLLPPFLIFGIFILLGKIFMSGFIDIQNVNENILQGIVDILVEPSESVAISLWYIYVLLELLLIMPIVVYLFHGSNIAMIAFGLILYFVPNVTHVFMLHSVFHYFIFFVIGKLAIDYYDIYKRVLQHHIVLFGIFMLSFISIVLVDRETSTMIIGIASILALHSLVYSGVLRRSNILMKLGHYSLIIYLMNTIIIGVSKGILFKFIPWAGWYFNLVYFPVLVVSAIIVSIGIKKYLFSHVDYMNKVTS